MKKKILSILSLAIIIVPCICLLTACVGKHKCEFSSIYKYNETHHWRECIYDSDEQVNYEEHIIEGNSQTCGICGKTFDNSNQDPGNNNPPAQDPGNNNPPAQEPDEPEETFTISLTSNNSQYGNVIGAGTYNKSQNSITIKAVAKAGYFFSHWEDGVLDATRTITDKTSKTYKAMFYEGAGESIKVGNYVATVVNGSIIENTSSSFKICAKNENAFGYWWKQDNQTIYSTSVEQNVSKSTINKNTVFTAEDTACGIYFLRSSIDDACWTSPGGALQKLLDSCTDYDAITKTSKAGAFVSLTKTNVNLNGCSYDVYNFTIPDDAEMIGITRIFTKKGGSDYYISILSNTQNSHVNSSSGVLQSGSETVEFGNGKGVIVNWSIKL